jgi:magnesium transporter
MHRELIRGRLDDTQEEVARLIAKYNLLALPIVDDGGRLKGIVTVDDAMDVILPDDWKARVPRVYQRA